MSRMILFAQELFSQLRPMSSYNRAWIHADTRPELFKKVLDFVEGKTLRDGTFFVLEKNHVYEYNLALEDQHLQETWEEVHRFKLRLADACPGNCQRLHAEIVYE